jgi:hypothetical protein
MDIGFLLVVCALSESVEDGYYTRIPWNREATASDPEESEGCVFWELNETPLCPWNGAERGVMSGQQ